MLKLELPEHLLHHAGGRVGEHEAARALLGFGRRGDPLRVVVGQAPLALGSVRGRVGD
jgi:hypothetical protein